MFRHAPAVLALTLSLAHSVTAHASPWSAQLPSGALVQPAGDRLLIAGGADVECRGLESGEVLWRYHLDNPKALRPEAVSDVSVVPGRGIALLVGRTSVHAVGLDDGRRRWEVVSAASCAMSAIAVPDVTGDGIAEAVLPGCCEGGETRVLSGADGAVLAHSAEPGAALWTAYIEQGGKGAGEQGKGVWNGRAESRKAGQGVVSHRPGAGPRELETGNREPETLLVGTLTGLHCLDVGAGGALRVRWSVKGNPGRAGVVRAGDRLVLFTPGNTVLCLDAATGKERWYNNDERAAVAARDVGPDADGDGVADLLVATAERWETLSSANGRVIRTAPLEGRAAALSWPWRTTAGGDGTVVWANLVTGAHGTLPGAGEPAAWLEIVGDGGSPEVPIDQGRKAPPTRGPRLVAMDRAGRLSVTPLLSVGPPSVTPSGELTPVASFQPSSLPINSSPASSELRPSSRLSSFLCSCASLFLQVLPFYAFGVLAVGFLTAFVPPAWVDRALRGREGIAVAGAAAAGVLAPVCSCGVVPLVAGMARVGVPAPAALAFLISAPIVNPVTFLATAGTLGTTAAVWRTGAAAAMGLGAGWGLIVLQRRGWMTVDWETARERVRGKACAPGGAVPSGFPAKAAFMFRAGADEFFILLPYLAVGVLLGSGVASFVDESTLAGPAAAGPWVVPLAVAVGIPAYVCTCSDIPVAAALMQKGVSLGPILAFMVAGSGTSVFSLILVTSFIRGRLLAYYLGVMVAGSLAVGYAVRAFGG